jgi:hypothetical protein
MASRPAAELMGPTVLDTGNRDGLGFGNRG